MTFVEVVIAGLGEKVCFTVDLTTGGTYSISLETDAEVPFNFSGSFDPYEPLDLNEIDLSISPDCGDESGVISVITGEGQIVSILNVIPSAGTVFGNDVINLPTDEYLIYVTDLYCTSIDTIIFNIDVPDGSLSHDVTEVIPIRECVHDSLEVDGLVTGGFYGDITGGSGLYDVSYLTAGGAPIIGPDFGYQSISNPGLYGVLVIDEESGCDTFFEVNVPLSEVDVDISVLSITPLVVNTAMVLQEGEIEVEAEYNGGPAAFDYVWSPTGGANGNTAAYSELTAPGIYTVVATLAGETCAIELEVELIENDCNIPGDFDSDGDVDSQDYLIFLGAYGNPCSGCPQDLNGDGLVNSADLGIFAGNYPMIWTTYCGY